MARIRSNFFSGTLSSQLLSGSTTLMSAALSSFPEVASPDVAYLVIDPEGLTPEIVKVTAHSVAATSATVERGQDSTTDRTWSAGAAVIQAPIASDVDASELASDAAFTGSYVALIDAAVNVLARDNPNKNAVADGSSHPLSERFATLAAAQAVFPRATALTEQIDRHALQEALDNHPAVYAPAGTYMIDATVFTGDGTYDQGYGSQLLYGDGSGVTTFKLVGSIDAVWVLASGNCRGLTTISGPSTSDIANACDSLRFRGFTIDGNRDNTTTGNTSQQRHGAYFGRCPNLDLEDIEAKECRFDGLVVNGVSDEHVKGLTVRRVHVHDNDNRGMSVRLQIRQAAYDGVYTHHNDGDGIIIDHSESVVVNINADTNGGYGIFVRNTQSNRVANLRATSNAYDGIRFSEFVNGHASGLVALSNGTDGDSYHDVIFDDNELGSGYGATHNSRVSGIVCGVAENISGGGEGYALYIADGVSALDIDGLTVTGTGATGLVRRGTDQTVRIVDWDPIVLGAKELTRLSATATFTEGGAYVPYWLFDDGQSDSSCGQFRVPNGWQTANVTFEWTNVSASSGDVKFDLYQFTFTDGDTISVSVTTPDQTTTVTAPAQNVVETTTFGSAITVTPGENEYITVRRNGTDGGDTLAGGVGLLSVRLERVS